MASASAGSPHDTSAAPVAGGVFPNAAPADTTQLDKLCEKALTADLSGRHVLASAFFRRAAEEALRLHGETFVCTYLTLERAVSLGQQSNLEGVTDGEMAALDDEAWALTFNCLPLIVRRMDDNTMLPGRGTAVELAFFKRYSITKQTAFRYHPLPFRRLQLVGLSLGYASALRAAYVLLTKLSVHRDVMAQAFVLRVVDCMLPSARSLTGYTPGEESEFAYAIQQTLSGAFPYNATLVASIRSKWTSAAMVQMRRERGLLDAPELAKQYIKAHTTRWRADVTEHGLKDCALPSCDKREASVQQYKFSSACRSVWYCSEEHGALHWAEHKPVCRATVAANEAAAGGGAGAA